MGTAAEVGVRFDLERYEAEYGRLVVQGRWHGIAGRRFLRPVLQLDGRRLMAVLDHKPWAAEDGTLWTAAFAHDGEPGSALLQVAPDIVVELSSAGAVVVRDVQGRFSRVRESSAEADARSELARARLERDDARAEADRLRAERVEASAALERTESERDAARRDAERLRTERDEAVAKAEQNRLGATAARHDAERLQAEVDRLSAENHALRRAGSEAGARVSRALAERDAALGDLSRARDAPPPAPLYVSAPARRRPSWTVRFLAVVATGTVALLLVQLLAAVL